VKSPSLIWEIPYNKKKSLYFISGYNKNIDSNYLSQMLSGFEAETPAVLIIS